LLGAAAPWSDSLGELMWAPRTVWAWTRPSSRARAGCMRSSPHEGRSRARALRS